MQRLLARRAFDCANARPAVVIELVRGFRRNEELLAGNEVRRREINDLCAFWGDSNIRHDQVGFAGLQQRNAVGRIGGNQFKLHAERGCQRFGEVHVVTHDLMRFGINRAKRRVGIKRGDFHHPCCLDIRQLIGLRLR